MEFIKCALFLTIAGLSGFVFGLMLPRNMFLPDKFPLKSFFWENEGKNYEKLYIRKWKNKVPDMSKICKHMVPKSFDIASDSSCLKQLIYETCVAEFIHWLLIVVGFYCTSIWQGTGGVVVSLLWMAGNLPFIFIQRYNRPKIIKTYRKMSKIEDLGKEWLKHDNLKNESKEVESRF